VGKKAARAATARNYMKRVVREIFRTLQQDIPALDLVVRVRKRFDKGVSASARDELTRHLTGLKNVSFHRSSHSRLPVPDQPAHGPELSL
jgi:ribonuclease P protein component